MSVDYSVFNDVANTATNATLGAVTHLLPVVLPVLAVLFGIRWIIGKINVRKAA